MLHFYLSPLAADAQRLQPITAELPACDDRFVGEGNGCIVTWLFEKCQPSQCEALMSLSTPHVSMRTVPTVSQYGLIALSLTLSFFLLKQTCISFFFIIIRSIIFLWKTLHSNKLIYVVFPVMVRVRFVVWGVKGNTYTGQDRASTHHYGIIMTKGLYHSECCPHTCTAP